MQAQYNSPTDDGDGIIPHRVRVACEYLAEESLEGSDLMMAMVEALSVFDNNASTANGCFDTTGVAPNPENIPGAQAQACPLVLMHLKQHQQLHQKLLPSLSWAFQQQLRPTNLGIR